MGISKIRITREGGDEIDDRSNNINGNDNNDVNNNQEDFKKMINRLIRQKPIDRYR